MESLKEFFLYSGFAFSLIFIAIILIVFGIKWKSNSLKQICYNLAAVFIAVFLYEVYLGIVTPNVKVKGSINLGYYSDHELLGYGPPKEDKMVTAKRINDGEVIYDVSYTIKDRMRYTPNSNLESRSFAIFLGGSFTFGEGLLDDETLAYYYNEASEDKYLVKNYGFHGYGAQHALAIIENYILTEPGILDSDTVNVFYLYIPDHIRRAAGNTSWNKVGPRYEVEDGKLVSLGSSQDEQSKPKLNRGVLKKVRSIWRKSNIYSRHFRENLTITEDDVNRIIAMIREMNNKLSENGMKFHVILDSSADQSESFGEILKMLQEDKISTFQATEIIPGLTPDNAEYYIEGDGHPTKLYNQALARSIVNKDLN